MGTWNFIVFQYDGSSIKIATNSDSWEDTESFAEALMVGTQMAPVVVGGRVDTVGGLIAGSSSMRDQTAFFKSAPPLSVIRDVIWNGGAVKPHSSW